VTPAYQGKGAEPKTREQGQEKTPAERRASGVGQIPVQSIVS